MKNTIFLLLVLVNSTIIAQNSLKANLSDGNIGVSYASVNIKHTDFGTYSDSLGNFELLNLKIGDTISFSRLGFETKEIALKRNDNPDRIVLNPDAIKLDAIFLSNYKSKWEKPIAKSKQRYDKPYVGLFVGESFFTSFKSNHYSKINGIRFLAQFEGAIILRPIIVSLKNPDISLLKEDYVKKFDVKKTKTIVEFNFNEFVDISQEEIYIGIEFIKIDSANDLGIVIEASDEKSGISSFCKGKTNLLQKKPCTLERNNGKQLYFELKAVN